MLEYGFGLSHLAYHLGSLDRSLLLFFPTPVNRAAEVA